METSTKAEDGRAIARRPGRMDRQQRLLVGQSLASGYHVFGSERWVTLGRSRECEVPVLTDEVSRHHARISIDVGGTWIEDMKSTNGTFVNGARVQGRRRLQDGDTIRLGAVELAFVLAEGTRDEVIRRFDPRAAPTNESARPPELGRRPQLAGHFSGSILLEACQLLELNRRSGEMRITACGLSALLRFRDGVVVDARAGSETGEAGARLALGFRAGEYAFYVTPPEEQPGTLALRLTAITMDLLRQQDESVMRTRVISEERRAAAEGAA